MKAALITGSAGLIGSESVRYFANEFDKIIGIDDDHRAYFFGKEASTKWIKEILKAEIEPYEHHDIDIRDYEKLKKIFEKYGSDISLVIHTAAQPSHDWAAKEPLTDFTVNANGTINLLELSRLHCKDAVFIFTSTNKVYGDTPNRLPLIELDSRWEVEESNKYYEKGIDETMSIDHSKHSLFGVSKIAADIMVQEYGRYFDLKTATFRSGCLTGPQHAGVEGHGFLSYLVKCAMLGQPYTIYGYNGKQVRDNMHAEDLVRMFDEFYKKPISAGQVYNAGGSRYSNCSILEAIELCKKITGKELKYTYSDVNRIGDHIWYISDISKFRTDYPDWEYKHSLEAILTEISQDIEKRLLVKQ